MSSRLLTIIKKVAVICCTLSLFTGCASSGGGQPDTLVVNEVLHEVDEGIEGLMDYDKNYMVSVGVEMLNSATYYIECNDSENSYTQYSVTDNGLLGTIPYERADNTQFMLYDWLTTTNQGYLLNQNQFVDNNANEWLSLPSGYAQQLQSRRVLFLDIMRPTFYDFEKTTPMQIDFGSGIVTMQMYKGKIKSDAIKEALGLDSLGLYKALRVEAEDKSDTNMLNLLDIYIADLDMDYTFSDGILTIGIYNGIVRYVVLEVGGLGNRLIYTKTVLDSDSNLIYGIPTFSSVSEYYGEVKQMADYVAEYDSYDDAMNALYGGVVNVGGDTQKSSTEAITDEATEGTTEEVTE